MNETASAGRPYQQAAAPVFRGRYLSITSYKHDGRGVATPVWLVVRDGRLLVETDAASGKVKRIRRNPQVRVAAKGRNLLENQKVSLLVVDPGNTSRYIQIRGDAELVTQGAREHLDALTRKYTSHPAYYGHIYPEAQRLRETRVICRIHPRRVTLDAIHIADH